MLSKYLKDPLSGLTHMIGVILAAVGLGFLVYRASATGPWHMATYIIFGISMVLLYTVSTLYHWLPLSDKGTGILRKFDHGMIFFLIAGTYTPICLIPLRGPWGWSIFGTIWGLAFLGIGFKILWIKAPRWLSTIIYIVMGWLIIIAIWPLVHLLPTGGLLWLLAGGLFYTGGAVIYAIKKPDPWPKVFGFHEIFHIFVILGSICHFWLIYHYFSLMK